MLKAGQSAVVHQANVKYIKIRQAEMDYFTAFYGSFGTQSALLGVMAMSALAQTPGLDSENGIAWSYVYWIGSAFTNVSGCFSLVLALFVVVYAQGFGLRGPLGSMVKSVEGMIEEQQRAVTAFVIAMMGLNCVLIGIYFIMMDFYGALFSSLVTVLFVVYQYHSAVRIVNRFAYKHVDGSSAFAKQGDDPSDDYEEPQSAASLNSSLMADQSLQEATTDSNGPKLQKKKTFPFRPPQLSKMMNSAYAVTSGDSPDEAEEDGYHPMGDDFDGASDTKSVVSSSVFRTSDARRPSATAASSTPSRSIAASEKPSVNSHSGYLSMKVDGRFTGFSWQRRFLFLKGKLVFCYKSLEDWQRNPNEPLLRRPISLTGYSVSSEAYEHNFTLLLTPSQEDEDGKTWEFRCDTVEELNTWKQAFQRSLE